MNWLDVSTYISEFYIRGPVIIILLVSLIPAIITGAFLDSTLNWGDKSVLNGMIIVYFVVFIFATGACLIPTHDKILKVKLARIKNEAVNKENISKGVETLERIGKKLECKYLGCEENND